MKGFGSGTALYPSKRKWTDRPVFFSAWQSGPASTPPASPPPATPPPRTSTLGGEAGRRWDEGGVGTVLHCTKQLGWGDGVWEQVASLTSLQQLLAAVRLFTAAGEMVELAVPDTGPEPFNMDTVFYLDLGPQLQQHSPVELVFLLKPIQGWNYLAINSSPSI